jgi:hypothetical protein
MKNNRPLRRLLQLINLESDLDSFDNIHETIEKDLVFKGTNLWILVFAILVASIGLNMNSTAVIIGAMLISPLMGPINGIGYSIATPNRRTIRLVYGGSSLSPEQKEEISSRAANFNLKGVVIDFYQGFSYADAATRNSEVETLKAEINRLNMVNRERNAKLSSLETKPELGGELLAELVILYPQVSEVSYSETLKYKTGKNTPDTLTVVAITLKGRSFTDKEQVQVEKWLSTRLGSKSVKVYYDK